MYTIVGFSNGQIALNFHNGIKQVTINFPVPIVEGKYITGATLDRLLENYINNAIEASSPPIASNEEDIQALVTSISLTPKEIEKQLSLAVQRYLNNTAIQYGYNNIISACTYTNSSNLIFSAESQAFVLWRDAVWTFCYSYLSDVSAGTKSIPTESEIISLLPVFIAPEGSMPIV
jgi:hypothetical protein